jgi:hypothetical protein
VEDAIKIESKLLDKIKINSMIYIGSGMTENYYSRAMPYFKSLHKAIERESKDIRYFFIGLDFNPDKILKEHKLEKDVISVRLNLNKIHDPQNNIIQHGDFLEAEGPWKKNDYVLWLDCDTYFQRPLSNIDIENFKEDSICAGILPN